MLLFIAGDGKTRPTLAVNTCGHSFSTIFGLLHETVPVPVNRENNLFYVAMSLRIERGFLKNKTKLPGQTPVHFFFTI